MVEKKGRGYSDAAWAIAFDGGGIALVVVVVVVVYMAHRR